MIQKLAVISCLILSVTCTILHQPQIPVILVTPQIPQDNVNYNFAYEVNDYHTGDIKNQHESRRGDTVIGQYSLVQPDGIKRIVDYRANDIAGFQATVNNEGTPITPTGRPIEEPTEATPRQSDVTPSNGINANVGPHQPWVVQSLPNVTPPSVAISRTSIVQSISNSQPNGWPTNSQNPWA